VAEKKKGSGTPARTLLTPCDPMIPHTYLKLELAVLAA